MSGKEKEIRVNREKRGSVLTKKKGKERKRDRDRERERREKE